MTKRRIRWTAIALTFMALALTSSCKRSSRDSAERERGRGSSGTGAPPVGSAPVPGAGGVGTTGQLASSAPMNLISMAAGTITREWPPSATDQGGGPNAFILHNSWYSKSGVPGPYAFVFEFAAPAEIDSLVFQANESNPAQAVRVEVSTQSSDSGYSTLGNYTLQAITDEQTFPLPRAVAGRWLRVTVQQRLGAEYTSLSHFFAYGKIQPSAAANPISGVWLYDNVPGNGDDKLFQSSGKLDAVPDPALVNETYGMLQIVQQGSEFRAGLCHATSVSGMWSGSQAGTRVTWANLPNADALRDGVLNVEGKLIVGATPDGNGAYLLMRLAPGLDCAHLAKPVGSGQTVLVLNEDGHFTPYPPPLAKPEKFPGNRFVPLSIAVFTPEALAGVDTVVLGQICDLGKRIAPWQAQALLDFAQAGHKLIIHDADNCTSTDYSFLPYPFRTSNPGRQGASSPDVILVEASTLGNDTKDSKQSLDLKAWFSDPGNEIGDSNTVTTSDSHWCGHLMARNTLNVYGFVHMYAPFGQGLFIYNGFDKDDHEETAYAKVLLLELQQPVPALLPCTESVARKFLIAPSKQVPFASGRAQQVRVALQVIANLGYADTIALASKAPVDAQWKTALSIAQVTVKGDAAPLTLTIDVPANVGPGGHEFLVSGQDSQGNTATATITLVAAAVAEVEKVQTVANGCTQQLTVGSDALFAFAEATLTPTAQKTLVALGPAIKKAGDHPVQIHGYTDSIGSDNYNQLLSEQRARAVRDWLAAHHYIATTTPIQGFGKKNPVAPNSNSNGSDNSAGRAQNRRVEVLIDTCK